MSASTGSGAASGDCGGGAHRGAKRPDRIAGNGRVPAADAYVYADSGCGDGARMGRMASETKIAVTGTGNGEAPKKAPAMPVLNIENLKTSIEEIKAMGGSPPWNKILVRNDRL